MFLRKNKNYSKFSALIIWLLLLFGVVLAFLLPVTSTLVRYYVVTAISLLWLGGLFIFWKYKLISTIIFFSAILFIGFVFLPGKDNPDLLRSEYVKVLEKYEGAPYHWGGENQFGIDCSGLVRKGFIVANFQLALKSLNAKFLRNALKVWWFDCTAWELKDGYRNMTTKLFVANSINSIKSKMLIAGDVAVTSNGIHTLVYLGNDNWIEADPGIRKVIKVKIPVDNHWFETPVQIIRWRQLMN